MKVGNEIAAVVIGIVCKGRHVTHISAYNLDPQFIRSGAGSLLIDATVRNCLDMELNNFDMMAPGDAYKYEWSDASVKVSDYAVPLTPRGQAYAAFGSCAYCAKAVFETAPQSLRRALLALAGHRR
jgi:CelD/BcsL family acetyltransferase involved in cellulose biosynthesis